MWGDRSSILQALPRGEGLVQTTFSLINSNVAYPLNQPDVHFGLSKADPRTGEHAIKGEKMMTISVIIWCVLLRNKKELNNNRFEDFHKMNEMEFPILSNPFNFEASQAPVHLQMELIDVQSDSILKEKFKEVNALTFYTQYFKSLDNYPELKKHAARILCMFGGTYLCEHMFFDMKINKNKHRTRLTNEHLQSVLKIITTNMIPDINELVKNKRSQVSGFSSSK
ncbi:hypothetical protein ACJJTC_009742 [Scirpophaga incertulas]